METHKVITRTKEIGNIKSLLNKGLIPGIVYGKGTQPTKIAFEDQALKQLIQSKGFYTKIINIDIDGKKEKVLPKILQYNPLTDKIIHFDLLRVQDNTRVTVEVPVEFLNQDICPGIKKGGVLNVVRRTIELILTKISPSANLRIVASANPIPTYEEIAFASSRLLLQAMSFIIYYLQYMRSSIVQQEKLL